MKATSVLKVIFLLLVSLSFVSCSKTQMDESLMEEAELLDDVEGASDLDEVDGDDMAAMQGDEELEDEMVAADDGVDVVEDESLDEVMDNAQAAAEDFNNVAQEEQMASPAPAASTSGMAEYTVQENDSLMLIAYKIYGNYLRWRDLLQANPGLSPNGLSAGMRIQYEAPPTPFDPKGEGLPYLIIKGDTLGLISGKVYGSQQKWRSIWDNNRALIRDPNLIFAGFTIYYLEDPKMASN